MISRSGNADKNGVNMSLETYRKQSEINYFTFVVGYDILNTIDKRDIIECDLLYDFANYVATDYVNSDFYKDLKYSAYEMFYKYLDSKNGLQSIFDEYFKITGGE